jgi:hypothetical protein
MSDITFLELVPIVLSIFLFRHYLANQWIVFHTDNKALVSILNKKSSKSRRVMQLVRPFVLQTMIHIYVICNLKRVTFRVILIVKQMQFLVNSSKHSSNWNQMQISNLWPFQIFFWTVDLGNEVGRLIESSITENTREVDRNGLNCFDPFRELWSRSRLAATLISCCNFYFLSFIEPKIAYLSAITFPCKIAHHEGFTNNLLVSNC